MSRAQRKEYRNRLQGISNAAAFTFCIKNNKLRRARFHGNMDRAERFVILFYKRMKTAENEKAR
jgi:hypothetical protein